MQHSASRRSSSVSVAAGGLCLLLGACNQTAGPPGTPGQLEQSIETDNGLTVNGLANNGLAINGLAINGLSINGLSINGLNQGVFSSWFTLNLLTAPAVMSYMVKCALPEGQSLAWTNPLTHVNYTWPGELGLAPQWATGSPINSMEQQVMTACLAAHANKFGLRVPLSVRGLDATGAQLEVSPDELATYSVPEGCFFGNLFTNDGIYVGTAASTSALSYSSPRACAIGSISLQSCAPIVNVGLCSDHCTLDQTGSFYETCKFNGKTFRPLTTQMRPAEVYRCGDGVCQFTESCGAGNTSGSCKVDCGPCS